MAERPTTISAKYSDEWKRSATEASIGAKINKSTAPMVPPEKDEIAATVSALPALPWRASG